MATILSEHVVDIVNTTMSHYDPKQRATDIAQELREYIAVDRLLTENRMGVASGSPHEFRLITEYDANFKWTSMFAQDNLNQVNGVKKGYVPERMCSTGCTWDIFQEQVNEGTAEILNFIKVKKHQMYGKWVEEMEKSFWDGPLTDTDGLRPFGLLKYWATYNSSTTGGFLGGNHTNASGGPGNVNCDDYARWKHWAAKWTTMNEADAYSLLRDAFHDANFKAPKVNGQVQNYGNSYKWGLYTCWSNLKTMQGHARSNNENMGSELDKYGQDGDVRFHRVVVEEVPYLSTYHNTSKPLIGINWDLWGCLVWANKWMVETPFKQVANQHNCREMFMDCAFNWFTPDRRNAMFLIAYSDPMSD